MKDWLGRLSPAQFLALLAAVLLAIAGTVFVVLSLLGDLSGWRNFQG